MTEQTKPVEISVVIPALNEEEFIGDCIQSLKSQSFDRPYEIIVVDNSSSDRTIEVASGPGVEVVSEPHRGITWARQKGADMAKGEIIAFVDADTIVASSWLEQIYRFLENEKKSVAVSGKVLYRKSNNWRGRLPAYWVEPLRRADIAFRFLTGKPGILWGANFAVRKDALKKAGGINKHIKFFGEDTDLSMRLGKLGKIKYNKNQLAYTSPRRFENQPLLKTAWFYLSNYVSMVAFNRFPGDKQPGRFGRFGLFSKKALRAYGILLEVSALAFFTLSPASQFYGRVYSAGFNARGKVIALTFDDGPNEPYTSMIQKILDDNKIKATFFVIGNNAEYFPASVRSIIQHGYVIANHSYGHAYRLPFESNISATSWSKDPMVFEGYSELEL